MSETMALRPNLEDRRPHRIIKGTLHQEDTAIQICCITNTTGHKVEGPDTHGHTHTKSKNNPNPEVLKWTLRG